VGAYPTRPSVIAKKGSLGAIERSWSYLLALSPGNFSAYALKIRRLQKIFEKRGLCARDFKFIGNNYPDCNSYFSFDSILSMFCRQKVIQGVVKGIAFW